MPNNTSTLFEQKLVLNQWALAVLEVKDFSEIQNWLRDDGLTGLTEEDVTHFYEVLSAHWGNRTQALKLNKWELFSQETAGISGTYEFFTVVRWRKSSSSVPLKISVLGRVEAHRGQLIAAKAEFEYQRFSPRTCNVA